MEELNRRFGVPRKLPASNSLFELSQGLARVYLRYSRVHDRNLAFYGLRQQDLRQLEGKPGFIVFLWDNQDEPLIIRFEEYEDVFQATHPASDGQYKVQVFPDVEGVELYIAHAGRFNVESDMGWSKLQKLLDSSDVQPMPDLSHSQVQTLIGAIGIKKGYDIWVPTSDRDRLDWGVAEKFDCRSLLPAGFDSVQEILQEINVIWAKRGSNDLVALFEVEHSTPIYSGLLRFNDVHLVAPQIRPRFSVVANDSRRELFVRQLRRPTFKVSGLIEMCNFLDYVDVIGWHRRLAQTAAAGKS
jgi:hypothetical protein